MSLVSFFRAAPIGRHAALAAPLLAILLCAVSGQGHAAESNAEIRFRPRPAPLAIIPAAPAQIIPQATAPTRHDPAVSAPSGHDRAYYRAEPQPIVPPRNVVVTRPAAVPSLPLESEATAAIDAPEALKPPSRRIRRAALKSQAMDGNLPQGTEGRLPTPGPSDVGGSHLFPGRNFGVSARVFQTLTRDMCALTFDDGPSSAGDPSMLATLSAANIKATWFIVGRMAHASPGLVQQIAAGGHELAVHGWTHHDFRTMTPETRADELSRTAAVIRTAVPATNLTLFRPPYGGYNGDTLSAATAAGLTTVMWNVDSEDWRSRDAERIADVIMGETRPGGIILMHSTIPASADALPGVIANLTARGCHFYTVSEWLAEAQRRVDLFKTPPETLLTGIKPPATPMPLAASPIHALPQSSGPQATAPAAAAVVNQPSVTPAPANAPIGVATPHPAANAPIGLLPASIELPADAVPAAAPVIAPALSVPPPSAMPDMPPAAAPATPADNQTTYRTAG